MSNIAAIHSSAVKPGCITQAIFESSVCQRTLSRINSMNRRDLDSNPSLWRASSKRTCHVGQHCSNPVDWKPWCWDGSCIISTSWCDVMLMIVWWFAYNVRCVWRKTAYCPNDTVTLHRLRNQHLLVIVELYGIDWAALYSVMCNSSNTKIGNWTTKQPVHNTNPNVVEAQNFGGYKLYRRKPSRGSEGSSVLDCI
jgi:hypothetical protein